VVPVIHCRQSCRPTRMTAIQSARKRIRGNIDTGNSLSRNDDGRRLRLQPQLLANLQGDSREKLLTAILEIDEPIVLARLIALTPLDARTQIESRVDALTPTDAGDIRSLPEAMVRIEELLTPGRADTAAKFIEAERGLKALGPVAGRNLTQLRIDLHLKLLRHAGAALRQPIPRPTWSDR
jgi:hypothetical protein